MWFDQLLGKGFPNPGKSKCRVQEWLQSMTNIFIFLSFSPTIYGKYLFIF